MRCHNTINIVAIAQCRAEMSQDTNIVTWGSIMIYIPLESIDRVDDVPCHLSI